MRPKPRITRYIGLSTDTKPNADYGDTFREMDTGTIYMFDGETWHALSTEHEYSGDIVSFKARKVVPMQSVVVTMEPVQDLHGYDSPWPAGGGANKWDGEKRNGYYGADGIFYATTSATTNTANKNPIPVVPNTAYYFKVPNNNSNTVMWYDEDMNLISGSTNQQMNIAITSPSGAYFMNFKANANYNENYDIAINYPSTVTTYSPYSNECPISGRTGAEVTRCGKNLADTANALKGYISNNTGDFRASNTSACSDFINIKPDTDYTFTTAQTGGRYGAWYDANKKFISGSGFVGTSTVFTQHSPANAKYVRYTYSYENGNPSYVDNVMIELGSTATAYEPYTGDTISVSWESEAGTVYGGTLDVVSGELVVDRAKKTLSQNDSFTLSQSATRNRIAWDGYESVGKTGGLFVSNVLKSMPASSGGYGTSDLEIWGSTVAPRCWISAPLSYTIDDFKELLSSNPIEIVYELATPITYHLTPQEVRTLLGDNNVWSDAGPVTVKVKF